MSPPSVTAFKDLSENYTEILDFSAISSISFCLPFSLMEPKVCVTKLPARRKDIGE